MSATADVLRRTAQGYRSGQIRWGRLFFRNDDGCYCTAGGIAHAVDPAADPNPYSIDGRSLALGALQALALYLVDNGLAAESFTDGMFDPVETVADWNDAPGRTLDEVLAALDAAARITDRVVPA